MKYRIIEREFDTQYATYSMFYPQSQDTVEGIPGEWKDMPQGPFFSIDVAKAAIDRAIKPPAIKYNEIIHNYP
jgi:hypothetical protein